MAYFCIDVEASGPLPPQYNLLSIGATVVHHREDHHELGAGFYVELQPVFPGVDPQAMAVCGLDLERLRQDGAEPRAAMQKLTDWVREHNAGTGSPPVFVGHNAVFDWAYVNYYYAHYELKNPFGYKAIETKSLAMGALGLAWEATSKERLAKLLDLPPLDPAQVHRADYDAWYQALLFKALLDRRPG
jgi:DNA polymerase III alpha subunit (gram-positive type)